MPRLIKKRSKKAGLPPEDEWIQGLCREIERGAYSEKKP